MKDLYQESHEKTNNNAAWVSSKGKGNTGETLRQTQILAAGDIVIKAVDGLKIDVKQVGQQTVSQSIDAMVKTDPQLQQLRPGACFADPYCDRDGGGCRAHGGGSNGGHYWQCGRRWDNFVDYRRRSVSCSRGCRGRRSDQCHRQRYQ